MKYNVGRRNKKFNNLIGKRFGKLLCLKQKGFTPDHHRMWLCKCDCGKEKEILATNLLCKRTVSCGCAGLSKGSNNMHWTGYGEISGYYWGIIKTNATQRNIKFDISIEDMWKLFINQSRKCALTGVELTFPSDKKHKSISTASLDRIDSTKGYFKENVQWVHKDVNKMKMNFPEIYFIEMCKRIAQYKCS
jgi:hypothetical protein